MHIKFVREHEYQDDKEQKCKTTFYFKDGLSSPKAPAEHKHNHMLNIGSKLEVEKPQISI
jgi:hypothetical protein